MMASVLFKEPSASRNYLGLCLPDAARRELAKPTRMHPMRNPIWPDVASAVAMVVFGKANHRWSPDVS